MSDDTPDFMAIPGGLEPPTSSLEVRCSIQLSYGTILTTLKDRQRATANNEILPPNVNTLIWIIPYGRTNRPLVNRST